MNEEIEDYFIIYSHVHINCNHREALIINTENDTFFYTENTTFIKAFTGLSLPTVYYMFPITEDMKYDKSFIAFLELLEAEFCGEFIKTTFLNRPVQFSPQFKIANNSPLNMLPEFLEKNVNVDILKGFENELGNNILSHVLELSIYYSTLTSKPVISSFPIHRQYLFPIVDTQYSCFNDFSSIFESVFPHLCKINIIVGDLKKNDILLIKDVIQKYNLYNKISLYIVSSVFQNINTDFINLFSMVYVWHDKYSQIIQAPERITNLLLVDNEEDMFLFENNPNIHEIYPLYHGKNDRFCYDYLSFEIKDLMVDRKINDREIFMNQNINSNFFGEISIYPTGEVYSCKSRKSIGNIWNNNIKNIVFDELNTYRHWHVTRNSIPYCKDCVFNWICPPVTHNELEINKWDFCNKDRAKYGYTN